MQNLQNNVLGLDKITGKKLKTLILHTWDFNNRHEIVEGKVRHFYSRLWIDNNELLNRLLDLDLNDAQTLWMLDFLIKLENDAQIIFRDFRNDERRERYFKCIEILKNLVQGLETKQDLLSKEDREYLQSYVKRVYSNEKIQNVIDAALENQK
jgi:hypothetical protein